VVLGVLRLAGLTGPDQEIPASVRVKHGRNRNGKTLHFYLNYSSATQTIAYPYGAGADLLTQTPTSHGQTITVQPWGLAIVEENQ